MAGEKVSESAETGVPEPEEDAGNTAGETAEAEEAEDEAADQAGDEAADAEDEAENEAENDADSGAGSRLRLADPVRAAAIALVSVAALCAAYFGWSWYSAAHDDSLAFSKTRDEVLRAGEQGVVNMNTLDYRKIDQGLTSWEDSSTGDLHRQLVEGRSQFAAQVQQAKTVTTAKIVEAAVTELDARVGKASMIVALQITVTPPGGAPATKQSRMRAELTRTPTGWKLSGLGQAPVGTTGG